MRSVPPQGFTAIELLVVLALAAILLTLALPSFDGTIKRYRVGAAASEIASALQYARAQAITTRQNVTVGQSNAASLTGTGCATDGSAADWHCGIDVTGVNEAGVNAALKTIPATDFKALNVRIVPSDGSASSALIYTAMGYAASCDPTGVCSHSEFDGQIYIWPKDGSVNAQTSPYTQTVCAASGGKVHVIASYADSATSTSCPGT
jgi:prepilin-type N-terminal cleavage/methylation domain-containing protein